MFSPCKIMEAFERIQYVAACKIVAATVFTFLKRNLCFLFVWTLHVLPVFVCILSGNFGCLPQSKDMQFMFGYFEPWILGIITITLKLLSKFKKQTAIKCVLPVFLLLYLVKQAIPIRTKTTLTPPKMK